MTVKRSFNFNFVIARSRINVPRFDQSHGDKAICPLKGKNIRNDHAHVEIASAKEFNFRRKIFHLPRNDGLKGTVAVGTEGQTAY